MRNGRLKDGDGVEFGGTSLARFHARMRMLERRRAMNLRMMFPQQEQPRRAGRFIARKADDPRPFAMSDGTVVYTKMMPTILPVGSHTSMTMMPVTLPYISMLSSNPEMLSPKKQEVEA